MSAKSHLHHQPIPMWIQTAPSLIQTVRNEGEKTQSAKVNVIHSLDGLHFEVMGVMRLLKYVIAEN